MKRQWSSIFHFLLFSVFFQCIYAPGAHKFIGRNGRDLWGRCQPDGRCLGRNEDESRLATALFNGSVGERERISNCMGHCYDADSNCPSCFAQCVDKCVPMPNAASDSGG